MFEEFNHFFKNEDNDDTSGTSDFNTSNDADPDDCYCESANDSFLNEYKEYVSEMVDDFLQDSFDIIQEGSHKTNTRRKIHKLEHEAKKHDIDLKIDKYHNTSASVERDRTSGGVSKATVYVNPRDIYSTESEDVKNIFNHEKNHVLTDKRKRRDVDGYNRSVIVYKGDKDVDDIKLIKAFINSHRKMIKTPHSADIDEYLADLNSARETSFKSMINTLTELYLPEDKKNLKGLKKYHYEDLKNQIIINHDNMNKSPKDITHRIDNPSKETYETNKRRFNSVIGKDPRGFIAKDSVDLKNKLTQFKKIYETYESYVNYVRSHDVDIDNVITSYIDAYNSDLDMRIAFLKYAKDIFSPRSKPSPDQIKEYCVNDPLNELMQQQGIAVDDTSRKSNGTWIDVIQEFSNCLRSKLDMTKYSEESFNEIFDDLLHYAFIMEAAMDENMNEDTNVSDPDDCYCESEIFESGHFSKYAEGVDLSKARGPIPPRSNTVYTKDPSIKKIDDFPFDKVYFGSPHELPLEFKLDGPLFVTPYPGVASIFAVRPQHVSKYGVKGYCNRDYDEFKTSLKDTLLKKPLSELHVRLQCNDDIKPVVELVTGNIYELEVTPEIRDHIYQSSKMNKYLEFCIDKLPSVTFSSVKKVNVRVYITGEKLTQTEAFYKELKKELGQTKDPQPYQEAKLPAKKRNNLKNSDFGIVYTDEKGKTIRKYPLHDKAHVASAARMFGHCPLKYKAKLARKILRRAHEYDMDTSGWSQVNKYAKSK